MSKGLSYFFFLIVCFYEMYLFKVVTSKSFTYIKFRMCEFLAQISARGLDKVSNRPELGQGRHDPHRHIELMAAGCQGTCRPRH